MSRLIVSRQALAALRAHLAGAYPEEGCGILLGRDHDRVRAVHEAVVVENAATRERGRRYEIHPEKFLQVDQRAREAGLDVIGFFHSHPDHPAEPSAFDHERAWPYYSYLIARVGEAQVAEIRCWRLAGESGALESEAWSEVDDAMERENTSA